MDPFQLLGTVSAVSSSVISAAFVTAGGEGAPADFSPVKAGRLGTYVMVYDDGLSIIGSISGVRPEAPGYGQPYLMDIQLIGTLHDGRFERGVSNFPSIGSSVYTASADDLSLIFSFYRNENTFFRDDAAAVGLRTVSRPSPLSSPRCS